MNYAITILKKELVKEMCYKTNHNRELLDPEINVSGRRVYEMSVRLAEERIPGLKKAIQKLKPKQQTT